MMFKKFLTHFIMAILIPWVAPTPSFAFDLSDLSNVGKRGIEDLTRCINSKKAVDIYYLIDKSGSLKRTDPDRDRASIIAQSIRTLAGFKSVDVDYAVGFFGDNFEPWKSWTSVTTSNADSESRAVENKIRSSTPSDWDTNWQLGISEAQKLLQAKRSDRDSCQALIWLTDGGLWIGKDNPNSSGPRKIFDESKTKTALETLCTGTFESLRQAKVSVFGVLLRDENALNQLPEPERSQIVDGMEQMRPLIEGAGSLRDPDGGSRRCGTVPVPKNYNAGGLLIAQDPVALALQFTIITCGIDGCKPVVLDENFEIEPGVKRFQILTTAKSWTLKSPDGRSLSSRDPTLLVQENAGLTQVTVVVKPSQIGNWQFNYDKSSEGEPLKQLLLYSGLGIELEPTPLVAGSSGKISGKITYEDGTPVDLSVYGKRDLTIEEILGDGSSKSLVRDPFQPDDNGAFQVSSYTPTPSQSRLEIRVTLFPVTLKGQELAPVSISTVVAVSSPDEYPRLINGNPSVRLSEMKGDEPATGFLEFEGPKNGNGKVCFSDASNHGVRVLSDAVSRADEYRWTIDITNLDSDGCLSVSQGETQRVDVSVTNTVQGESEVKADIPLLLKSDQKPGQDLELPASVEFTTVFDKTGETAIKIALFALGILLPLAFSYLLTYLTTKLTFGPRIQRAEFPVTVSTRGILGADKGSLPAPAPEDFKLIPSQPDTRKYQDSIGTMRAKVSKLVFKDPWFEIESAVGAKVFTFIKSGKDINEKRAKRFASGILSPMKGNVEEFWALSIKESDLPKGPSDTVPARLVIYKRNDLKDPNQHLKRVSQVTTTSGIWQAVVAAAEIMRSNPTKSKDKRVKHKKEKPAPIQTASGVDSGARSPLGPVASTHGATLGGKSDSSVPSELPNNGSTPPPPAPPPPPPPPPRPGAI